MSELSERQGCGCPTTRQNHTSAVITRRSINLTDGHIGVQQERGVSVHHRKWDDTVHVEHFRKYPAAYEQELRRFTDHELLVAGLSTFHHPPRLSLDPVAVPLVAPSVLPPTPGSPSR